MAQNEMRAWSGLPVRVGSSEGLSIAVEGSQGRSILEWIKTILRAGNQNFDSVQRDCLDKLRKEDFVVCVASEDFRDNLIFTIKQLHAKTVANDVRCNLRAPSRRRRRPALD